METTLLILAGFTFGYIAKTLMVIADNVRKINRHRWLTLKIAEEQHIEEVSEWNRKRLAATFKPQE